MPLNFVSTHENFQDTKFTSGYIDLDGKFYGCPDSMHSRFAEHLFKCGIAYSPSSIVDHDIYLENRGWVKYSMKRFLFYGNRWTSSQKKTASDYFLVNTQRYVTYNQKEYTLSEFLEEIDK